MTALHRVKAYFGMVPADELDSYDGYDDDRPGGATGGGFRRDLDRYDDPRYDDPRYDGLRDGSRYEGSRYEARYDDRDDDRAPRRSRSGADRQDRYDESRYERLDADRYALDRLERTGRAEREDRLRTPRPRDPEPRLGADHDPDEETDVSVRSSARGRAWEHNTGPNHSSRAARAGSLSSVGGGTGGSSTTGVSGAGLSAHGAAALALEEEPRPEPTPAPAPEAAARPDIVTLQPTSYNEARVIGERYRDGIPVIMNLTEMDDVAAKRLVDFAAGLAFALRGSIEKVTNRVFLLSPPNVEVSPTDRRKLAESSYSASS